MGRATAKIVGRDHTVVLADNRADRLDTAIAELSGLGVPATAVHCDVTDPAAVGGRCSRPRRGWVGLPR